MGSFLISIGLRKKFKVYIALIIIICSCKNSKNIEVPLIKMDGIEILKDEVGVSSFYTFQDYVLLKMNKKVGYGLALYHKSNLEKPLARFAPFGEGPDEWGAIRVNGQTLSKNGTNYLVLNDGFKYRVRLLNLDRLIKDSVEVYDYTYDIDSKHGLSQSITFLNDSIIVSTPGIDSKEFGRLKFYNLKADSSWVSDLFPQVLDQNLSPFDFYSLYFSYIHVNEGSKKIASSMDAFDRIDIFDFNGNLENSYLGESDHYITENSKLKEEGTFPPYPVYYKYSTSSPNHIYGLYYNQLNVEIEQKEIQPLIKVIDWEGNLVANLLVDEYLSNIEVYKDESFLIGIDKVNEKIMLYDLKKVLL